MLLNDKLKRNLQQNGFLDLGIVSNSNTLEICKEIGHVFEPGEFKTIQTLKPRATKSSTLNTYSGNYGFNSFPFHTDLSQWIVPPRYFLLRCIEPDISVSTFVITFKEILKSIPLSIIEKALFKPRRKIENKVTLLRFKQDFFYRWDELFLVPDNNSAKQIYKKLTDPRAYDHSSTLCLNECGHTIIFDNWNSLHGRSSVSSNSKRIVERCYLSELK